MSHLSSALYWPLILLALGYVGLLVAGNRVAGRGDEARAERLRDIGFALVLLAAAYTVILLISAAVGYPSRFTDAVTIILVVSIFLVLLLGLFFVIAEVLLAPFGRRSRR